jgi:hypothetical protein
MVWNDDINITNFILQQKAKEIKEKDTRKRATLKNKVCNIYVIIPNHPVR